MATKKRENNQKPAVARAKSVLVQRACMNCGKPFSSEGCHNRMCGRCRSTACDYLAEHIPSGGED